VVSVSFLRGVLMTKPIVRLVAVAAAMAALTALPAQAGTFVPHLSGNTIFDFPSATSDGTVSFSVYDASTDADWTTALGVAAAATGIGGPVDTAAKLVFFYQVVNTNPGLPGEADDPLEDLEIPQLPGALISSIGFLSDMVFDDPIGGAVGPGLAGLNVALGPDAGVGDNPIGPGTGGDFTPSYAGFTPAGFVASAAAVDPTDGMVTGSRIEFNWGDPPVSGIDPGDWSSVVFFTVDIGDATYREASLTDGGNAFGDLPTATPVPAGLALLLTGLPGLAGLGLVLRRKES
jgi:hypothetical protein